MWKWDVTPNPNTITDPWLYVCLFSQTQVETRTRFKIVDVFSFAKVVDLLSCLDMFLSGFQASAFINDGFSNLKTS